jgi:hypothetical protein
MWPSPEAATLISIAANWTLILSLVVGTAAAGLMMWTAGIKEAGWELADRTSREKIAKMKDALTEAQAHLLAAGNTAAQAAARVADAEARALEANARVTEAEAALAVARYKAPRILAPEQASRIVERLLALPPATYDLSAADTTPAASLKLQMGEILKAAQWLTTGHQEDAGPRDDVRARSVDGVAIEIAESRRADWEAVVIALILALRAEGIHASGTTSPTADPGAIHLTIGGKPQSIGQVAGNRAP